jgi:hypothetical protein
MSTTTLSPRTARLCASYRNLALWTLQGWLAMFFLAAGYGKLTEPMGNLVALMQWPAFAPEDLVRGLGLAEATLALLVLAPLVSWRIGKPLLVSAAAGLLALELVMLALHAWLGHVGLALVNVALIAITVPVLLGRARERR